MKEQTKLLIMLVVFAACWFLPVGSEPFMAAVGEGLKLRRSIFLADQQFWPDRTRITLLVRAAQSDERTFVLERIYEMSEEQFRQYWIAKMFRAEVPRGGVDLAPPLGDQGSEGLPGVLGAEPLEPERLARTLRDTQGGRNLVEVGLELVGQ